MGGRLRPESPAGIVRNMHTGKDRRKIYNILRFFYNGPERRKALRDRRLQEERRDGWIRISKWSSVNLHNLKISKYLRGRGVYPKTRSLIFQVDLPSLNASS